jgi:hypothetical protein
MKVVATILLACFICIHEISQKQRKLSGYLWPQFNSTVYDKTLVNNTNGFGLGLQAFLNNKSSFKPTLEITGDLYPGGRKILLVSANGEPIETKIAVVDLFAGAIFRPGKIGFISFTTGPSFINGKAYLGIKPSIGFFSRNNKWSGKISLISVFQNDQSSAQDFGVVIVGLAVKLF